MANTEILNLMIKDHETLLTYLKNVEIQEKHGKEALRLAFQIFEWKLEKHLFAEERGIFNALNRDQIGEAYSLFNVLSKQHDMILAMIKHLKQDMKEGKQVQISKLHQMLIDHREYEERNVYPQLDRALNANEKHLMIKRISEML